MFEKRNSIVNYILVVLLMGSILLGIVGCKKNKVEQAPDTSPGATDSPQTSITPVPDSSDPQDSTDSQDSSVSGDSDENDSVIEDEDVYIYEPEEIIPVWTFYDNEEIVEWTNPIPFINPMGNEENYSEISFQEDYYIGYYYIDDENIARNRSVYGDIWEMQIPKLEGKTDEENSQFIYDLEQFVISKGAIIAGYYDDGLLYQIVDEDGVRWWAEAEPYSSGFNLRIARETELKVGETMVINTADYENERMYFSSYNSGDEFQSILLERDDGNITIDINSEHISGDYKRQFRTFKPVFYDSGNSFHFDDIMYEEGFSNWEVRWGDSSITKEIKITLLKIGEVESIRYGEPLGAIKVSSEHVSNIEALPMGEERLDLTHPEFDSEDIYLDRTPDGDFIVFVPAGYWNVKIYPEGESLVTNYETLMVPVHSGELTVIDIPYSTSNALKSSHNDYSERGVRIGKVTEDTQLNQASVMFTLLDSSTKDILPDSENTILAESGQPVKIIDIQRVLTPPSVVLLLDSSGSMAGRMGETLNAARSFIEGLPDKTKIEIIDFDNKPEQLTGTTKAEALSNLSKIKVNGNTALYEAIKMGLELLDEEDRPSLVVFTDGENDYRFADGINLEDTLELVKDSGVPLFTIGFGSGHDAKTLQNLAKVPGGKYFSAEDGAALEQVFAAINERLGSTFQAIYERPKEASLGDIPVVSFVIDTSGSMLDSNEDFGSRIFNVKKLIRQFVVGLPEEVQMQLTEFDDDVKIVQTLTTDKLKILRGLSRLDAVYGTEILGSIDASYKTLKEVPSTKKVLIYITDAALGTSYEENSYLREIMADFKNDDISVLWVGMGINETDAEDFVLAADISGGEYIVTEDINLLNDKFDEVLRDVVEKPSTELSSVFLSIEKVTDKGAREYYSTSILADLSPVKKSDDIRSSETINYTTGKLVKQYDSYTASNISGDSRPVEDTIIKKRMSAGESGSSSAVKITVDELIFMDKLTGVKAPRGYRFMAAVMSLENILEAQEITVYPDGSGHPSAWVSGGAQGETKVMKIPYMIPEFSSHFYITYNNGGSFPASKATWLLEKPLATPGNSSITIMPNSIVDGCLVFLVPDIPMEQMSMHFYDTNYGHVDVALVGEMRVERFEVNALPTQQPVKLSDSFELAITGSNIIEVVPGTAKAVIERDEDKGIVPRIDADLRVVEGNFISQMQALINIDPMARFSMLLPTANGNFHIPVNPATEILPSGFVSPRMLAPGSFNLVRWLFEVPKSLDGNESAIFLDLADGDVTIPIETGSLLPAGSGQEFDSEFTNITINNLVSVKDSINEENGHYVIADITVHDLKDEYSSDGIKDLFAIVTEEYFIPESGEVEPDTGTESKGLGNFGSGNGNTEKIILVSDITEELILGFGDNSVVYDGTSRRGFIVFELDYEDDKEWFLYSEVYEDLKMKVDSGSFDIGLLAGKIAYEYDYTFAKELSEAVSEAVAQYAINHPENSEQLLNGNIPLDGESVEKQNIPSPMISLYGAEKIDKIDSIEELITTIKSLKYIPSTGGYNPFEYSYAKEAVITQGFGKEQDIANLFVEVMSKLGYKTKLKKATLTDLGAEELTILSGIENISIDYLPVVTYVDDNNEYHAIVIPFMEELKNLDRLVYLDNNEVPEIEVVTAGIRIGVNGYYTGEGANAQIGDINDALGGGDGESVLLYESLYNDSIGLDILSLDAIDIGIAKDGNRVRVFLITADGEIMGDEYIEVDRFDIMELEIEINHPDMYGITHKVALDENMEIEDLFITLSINAPDLPGDTGVILQERANEVHEMAESPSELSALKWYGRSIINKFVSLQTVHEEELANTLDLLIGRTKTPRVIVITQKAGEKLQTSISLLVTNNDIHAGEEEAIHSFNIMSGVYASQLEGWALPGEANGLEEIWALAPEGTGIVLLKSYIDADMRDDLENAGVPEEIIVHFEQSGKMILIPDKPSIVNGRSRWAWYEIDEYTYEMISVIDTFENGSFVESTLMDIVASAGQHVVGAFKGIETSVWSVAVYSLEIADYAEILKKAKKLALGVAENFGFNAGPIGAGVGGTPSASQSFGGMKASFDGKASIGQNLLGFTDGFKAGVEYYFSKAE